MQPLKIKDNPEERIQKQIIKHLKERDWWVKSTHGNQFQYGFPDLFASHAKYGMRWIEVKNGLSWSFTPAQLREFPLMSAHGSPIWILCDPNEYDKLFKPENWYEWFVAYQAGCHDIYKWRGGKNVR